LATPTAIIAPPGNQTASSLIHRTPTRPSTPRFYRADDKATTVNHRRPFPSAVSKSWEPGAFEEPLGDVSSQLFGAYGGDTVAYPGHGDDTTLGEERPQLADWRWRGWQRPNQPIAFAVSGGRTGIASAARATIRVTPNGGRSRYPRCTAPEADRRRRWSGRRALRSPCRRAHGHWPVQG
jgi:hypothetical protein